MSDHTPTQQPSQRTTEVIAVRRRVAPVAELLPGSYRVPPAPNPRTGTPPMGEGMAALVVRLRIGQEFTVRLDDDKPVTVRLIATSRTGASLKVIAPRDVAISKASDNPDHRPTDDDAA